ncbi:MAG: hypothetical protein J5932_03480 [Prevotella sp.]|nr:hypothetical protein [Prevotella sp.]
MKFVKWFFLSILLLLLVVGATGLWLLFGSRTSNPHNYKRIGDIPVPNGYERVIGTDAAYSQFLRDLPLKPKGSKVKLYTGGDAFFQSVNYAVLDIPMLSNAEQCADACMRLRAEYLHKTHQYSLIHFQDVNGHTLRYNGGASRKALDKYLKNLYGVANTYSLNREMPVRPLSEMQPGDVFVYPAHGNMMGHAIMVVDVAVNRHGKKAFLLAEGSTPACEIHMLRNIKNPLRSPWFTLYEDSDYLLLGVSLFSKSDLKHF